MIFLFSVGVAACDAGDSPLGVDGIELAEIRIEPQETILHPGIEVGLDVVLIDLNGREVEPGPYGPTVRWEIEAPAVAQVTQSGRLSGVANGITTVVAAVGDLRAEGAVIVQPQMQGIGFEVDFLEFDGIAGLPLDDDVAVRVVGPSGSGVSGVTVRFASRPGSGSVTTPLALTDSTGVARTEWTLGRRAGVHRVVLTIPSPTGSALVMAEEPEVAGAPPGRNPHGRLIGRARPGSPKEIIVSPNPAAAEEADTVQFTAEVRDQHGNGIPDAQVTWSSTETEVATIDEGEGVAEAQSEGISRIQAEAEGVTGASTLTVGDGGGATAGPVETLRISPESWTMAGVGDTIRLHAIAEDKEGLTVSDAEVEWTSADPEIATVTSEGLVTAKAIGSALITATLVCAVSGCEEITAGSDGAVEDVDEIRDPGQITDLRVVDSTTGSLTVAFTEVDDGTGLPASYALRYGSPTISWGEVHPTEVVVSGSEIGSTREFEYTGLDPDADYQFQLVAYRGTLNDGATFGELSNVATGTTSAVEPGAVVSVAVTPSTLTIRGIGSTAQLQAEAKDGDGNTVPDASFEWSSSDPNIATVTQEGVVQANALGNAIITAAVICGSTACESSTEPNGSAALEIQDRSELYPNEPAGYTPWISHDWQSMPDRVWSESREHWTWDTPWALSDVGYWHTGSGHFGNTDRLELVDDDGPHGYGKALRLLIPEGHQTGRGVLNWNFRHQDDMRINDPSPMDLREFYISFWFFIEKHPDDDLWDGSGTFRIFSVNRHVRNDCNYGAEMIVTLHNGNAPSHPHPNIGDQLQGTMLFARKTCTGENWSGSTIDNQWDNPLPHGQWHQYELQWQRVTGGMTGGDEDGTSNYRVWLNGELQFEALGVEDSMANPMRQMLINTNPNHGWRLTPSDEESIKTRDDYMRMVGFYVSGVPK